MRPGNYVFFDRTQVALGAATLDDCALTVIATVVTKPSRTASSSTAAARRSRTTARGIPAAAGYGAVLAGDRDDARLRARDRRALTIERLSEEHATVRVAGDDARSNRAIASASCPTTPASVSNLVDVVRLVDGDSVIDTLPVAARGRIQ